MKNTLISFLPKKSITKNAWVYALGTYSSKIISLIIFPIIAVELGFIDTGRYDLVISTVAILGPVFSIQIGDAIYRWLSDPDEKNRTIGFTSGIVILITMTVLVALAATSFHLISPRPFLIVGATILISQMLLNTAMQVLRGNGQVRLYAASMIIRSVVFTVGELWAVFYSENKLQNVLAAFAVANLTALVVCMLGGIKKGQFSLKVLRWHHCKTLLLYSFPLVINALGWLLLVNANKYIIESRLGFEMNGVFAVAEKLASPIFFLGIFFFFSSQDYFHKKSDFKSHRSDFGQLLKKVGLITILGLILLISGAHALLPWFFPGLVGSIEYLPMLVLANLFMTIAVYLSIPYTYQKKSLSMAATTLAGILFTLTLSFVLTGPMGLYGVCVAILAGTLLIMGLRIHFARSFFTK